jgi:hypothetical protein
MFMTYGTSDLQAQSSAETRSMYLRLSAQCAELPSLVLHHIFLGQFFPNSPDKPTHRLSTDGRAHTPKQKHTCARARAHPLRHPSRLTCNPASTNVRKASIPLPFPSNAHPHTLRHGLSLRRGHREGMLRNPKRHRTPLMLQMAARNCRKASKPRQRRTLILNPKL